MRKLIVKKRSGFGLLPVKYAFAADAERGGGKPNAMLALSPHGEQYSQKED